jgi:Ca2+-binding EF-hand superfamily protein
MAEDGTIFNKDRFDAQGNPLVRRSGNESRTTEPDEMICSPCPQGSKCFADNIVVAHPGKWVDPTGEMIPHAITYQKDAPDQIDETKIRAVACLPLNCPGYCSVAYELEEDFLPTGNAPDCVKSLWKLCSSRDPAIQQNQTLDWTSSLEPWQTAVQQCVKEGEQLRGWREKTDGNWPPVHNLTEDEIQRYFDDLSVDLVNVITAANVCRKGSTGRLCSSCLDGYEKVEGTCVSCLKTDYMSMIQPLLVYSLMCVFFMHKSRRVITGRDCDIHNSSCIIGITVFFIQTLTLLKFNFGVSGVQNKLVGVMRMQLDDPEQDDGECLATGKFYVDYATKYTIQVFMLTFSAIISVAFKLKPWQRKMTVFFALQFSLFPINLRSMQIWFCRDDLAESTEYLYVDPAIRCYDADHYTANAILSCVIAAFAVVMPYMLYTRMRYSMDAHEKLLKVECYLNFGFKKGKEMIETGVVTDFHSPEYAARDYTSVLYYPLRRQTFWWAIVWLLRPSMIAFVYNARDPSTGSFFRLADWRVVVLIMLMIYNCVQASIRPFKHSNESQLDAISVLLLMLMFVLNINQDFMGASGAEITRVQTLNMFATFILMACVLLATFMSKKATAMQIAKMIARSRWKTAWNSMSSDSSDPLAEVGSLVTEVEKGSEKKRFAKLTQLGIAKKLPIFEQIDVDGSGMISLDEFLEWWTLRTLRTGAGEAMKDVARDLFTRFDVDGSGEVDREEFEQILGGLRAWHEEQKALMAQIEEPIEVRQAEVKAEVGRVIANMQSKGWMLVGTQWTRHADAAAQLNPLHDGGASASFEVEGRVQLAASADNAQPTVAAAATTETQHNQTQQHEQPTAQAPTVEDVFAAIDIDGSGELSFHEFMHWWRGNGGDEMALVKAQEAFRLVELRDGIPGVSLVELKEVMVAVATDTWEEAIDPASGRKYFVNPATKESSWLVPGIECVQPFLLAAGITQAAARTQHHVQQAAAHPAHAPQAGGSVSRGAAQGGVRDALVTSMGGGHQPTGSALLDGLRQSAVVDTMINQMASRQTREIRQSEFTDWWAQHKRPDLPVMQSLKFSRTFSKAFDAHNGTLGAPDALQVLASMWEEKADPQSGQLYYVHAASKESVWGFGAAEADAWLQKMVAL